MQLAIGTLLSNGRYKVKNCIGDGGFGITYVAEDTRLDREVVLKEYFPDYMARRDVTTSNNVRTDSSHTEEMQAGISKFMNEARTLAHLNHISAIATVHDFFEENSTAYIVMEYIKGSSLKEIIRARSVPYSFDEAMAIIGPCMYALHKIHETGIIHRDFAPDNILIDERGQVKIIDFGASRDFVSASATMTIMVKHGYAPFEQYSNAVKQGPYTDVYSLAAILYEMLTLKKPMSSTDRVLSDPLKRPMELNQSITPGQDAAIMKGLAVAYTDRYQTVGEFSDALYGAKGGAAVQKAQTEVKKPVSQQVNAAPDEGGATELVAGMPDMGNATELVASVPDMGNATELVASMPDMGNATELVAGMPDMGNATELVASVPDMGGYRAPAENKSDKSTALKGVFNRKKLSRRLIVSCILLILALINSITAINYLFGLRSSFGEKMVMIVLCSVLGSIVFRVNTVRKLRRDREYSKIALTVWSLVIIVAISVITGEGFHFTRIAGRVPSLVLLVSIVYAAILLYECAFVLGYAWKYPTDGGGKAIHPEIKDTAKKRVKLLSAECIMLTLFVAMLANYLGMYFFVLAASYGSDSPYFMANVGSTVKLIILTLASCMFLISRLIERNKTFAGEGDKTSKLLTISTVFVIGISAYLYLLRVFINYFISGVDRLSLLVYAAVILYEIIFIIAYPKDKKGTGM